MDYIQHSNSINQKGALGVPCSTWLLCQTPASRTSDFILLHTACLIKYTDPTVEENVGRREYCEEKQESERTVLVFLNCTYGVH